MPARQRGSTVRRGDLWGARWYDEQNVRRFRGGFPTRTAAREWVDDKTDEVEKLRNGDPITFAGNRC